jgi:hypothetical protein
MSFGAVVKVVRTVLGRLTDVLLIGRQAGLWTKGKGPDIGGPKR